MGGRLVLLGIDQVDADETAFRIAFDDKGVNLDRDHFLAAVASELDVTILNLSGYGVAEMPDGSIKAGKALAEPDVSADVLDDIGRCYLALARYRRTHPPVDEAEVEALAEEMYTATGEVPPNIAWDDLARRLVAAGWKR